MGHLQRNVLALGLLALALIIAPLAMAWPAASARLRLEQARARWAARPFDSYRLEVEQTLATSCRYVIEVRGDRISSIPFNTCSQLIWWRDMPVRTVDGILANLASAAGSCAPSGCACDGVVVMDGRFDRALGYPLEARLRAKPVLRWLHPEHWRGLLGPPSACSQESYIGLTLRVTSLTPLDT